MAVKIVIPKYYIPGQNPMNGREDAQFKTVSSLVVYLMLALHKNELGIINGTLSDIMSMAHMGRFSKEKLESFSVYINEVIDRDPKWNDPYVFSRTKDTPATLKSLRDKIAVKVEKREITLGKGEPFVSLDFGDLEVISKATTSFDGFMKMLMVYLTLRCNMMTKKGELNNHNMTVYWGYGSVAKFSEILGIDRRTFGRYMSALCKNELIGFKMGKGNIDTVYYKPATEEAYEFVMRGKKRKVTRFSRYIGDA